MLPAEHERACGKCDRVRRASPDEAGIGDQWAKILADGAGIIAIVVLAVFVGRIALSERAAPTEDSDAPPVEPGPCVADPEAAYLSGRLYGGIELQINWRGDTLACAGMLRPDDRGIRLIFASARGISPVDVTVVLGIDAGLDAASGTEHAANITVIEENSGRFFSSAGTARCWTTLHRIEPLSEATPRVYRVNGETYCAGALPALGSPGSVTLSDFDYSGQVTLDDDSTN